MTTPTQAPPQVAEQLSELPEFELRPDGTVQPLTAQNQAGASPHASQNGAGAETVASPAEPAAQPTPTQQTTPAPAPQPEAQRPAVEVVQPPAPTAPPQPAPAQLETTPAPAAAELAPEELATAEARLDAFLEQERQRIREEATRAAQSGFDKRAAQLDRRMQEAQEHEKALTAQIRELQTKGLSDEERAKVLAGYAQADERTELDEYRGQLVEYHKTLMVQSLMFEFKDFGVTQEALEQVDSPEEMEAHCYEQKATFLENAMNQARQQATQPAPAATVVQPAAAQPVAQPQPNIPAGVTAPVDIGAGGISPQGPQFNQGMGADALRDNLKTMKWDTVRINR